MDLSANPCVISLGFGGHYPYGVSRLERNTLFNGWAGRIMTWKNELPEGCPDPNDYPYGFKPYCFKAAFDAGCKVVLWADASMYPIKPIMPIFDFINEHGLYFFKSGYSLAETATDKLLEYAGEKRENLVDVSEFATGLVGINIENPLGKEFFEKWYQHMLDGMFRGSRFHNPEDSTHTLFKFSRQDQSSASIILHQMGIKTAGEDRDYIAYYGTNYSEPDLIFFCQGVG